MNRKRPALLCDIYTNKKRRTGQLPHDEAERRAAHAGNYAERSADLTSTLRHLKSFFPLDRFLSQLPPIIMKHQLYAFISNRTHVDRELNYMRRNGQILMFKLGENENELAIVFLDDYIQHVKRVSGNNAFIAAFLSKIILRCSDISYSKDVLMKQYSLNEENIRELVRQGVLTSRDIGCYWLSIPQAGEFVKSFLFGRRAILQHVRRTKYKQILQSELEQRKLPRKAYLGIFYHIYDLIGAELVKEIDTSSGKMLRLQTESENNS